MSTMSPEQMIEVLKAFQRGEKIEYRHINLDGDEWSQAKPRWNFVDCEYRVAKPKPKKVKLYGFIRKNTGGLHLWVSSDLYFRDGYYRAPQFDTEVEE